MTPAQECIRPWDLQHKHEDVKQGIKTPWPGSRLRPSGTAVTLWCVSVCLLTSRLVNLSVTSHFFLLRKNKGHNVKGERDVTFQRLCSKYNLLLTPEFKCIFKHRSLNESWRGLHLICTFSASHNSQCDLYFKIISLSLMPITIKCA